MIIKIQESCTINAIGEVTHGCRKPVVGLSDGVIYASAKDAAKANGTNIYTISNACRGKLKSYKGKQYCYLKDLNGHLDILMKNFREQSIKASAYDMQEATKRAEAERKANIIKLEEQILNEEKRIEEKRKKLTLLKGEQGKQGEQISIAI